MSWEKFKTLYHTAHLSIKRSFLDYSFPTVVVLTFIVGFVNLKMMDVFKDASVSLGVMYNSLFFLLPVWMAYAGYLGNKLYCKEFEDETSSSILLTPAGRSYIYAGKALAGVVLLGSLALLAFLQGYFSLNYFGPLSRLMTGRLALYALLGLFSPLYIFFLAASIGMIFKKTLYGMLFTSFYVIFSFPMMFVLVDSYSLTTKLFSKLLIFPYISIRVARFYIFDFGIVPLSIFLFPLLGIVWAFSISWIIFRGMKT